MQVVQRDYSEIGLDTAPLLRSCTSTELPPRIFSARDMIGVLGCSVLSETNEARSSVRVRNLEKTYGERELIILMGLYVSIPNYSYFSALFDKFTSFTQKQTFELNDINYQ